MELLTTVSKRYLCVCLCLLLALWVVFSGGLVAGAESPAPTMHQVEAAFLFNFAKFVTWPDDAFERSGSALIIGDRKSTRLNSSHDQISYAVFCLKKKKKKKKIIEK